MSAERHIPLILVNGRVSERSFNRWRHAPGMIAALLRRFDLCLAQSAAYAARYRDLGAPRISTTGNLKLDVPEPAADEDSLRKLQAAIGDRDDHRRGLDPCRRGDCADRDAPAVAPSFPRLLTIIAPRHPDRGPGIVEIARDAGLTASLRSRGRLPEAEDDIYVVDTLGELGLVYRLAPIVFMGGSLASHGGQNPVEPIKLGAAVLHGPHVWNFAELYEALDTARGAELIGDVGRLTVRVGALLTDARRARRVVAARRARPSSGSAARSSARSPRSIPISCRSGWSAAAAMREPPFWWRQGGVAAAHAGAVRGGLWRGRGERACTRKGEAPACRLSASATRPSAAPARRPPRWRWRRCSRPPAKRRCS